MDLHRKIMRAASQRTDANEARTIQRYGERESANEFLSGLLSEIHCQLLSKRHQANQLVIELELRGTLRPVRLFVDTDVEVFVIKHEYFNIPNCNGKKHHDIFVIMGKDKINIL